MKNLKISFDNMVWSDTLKNTFVVSIMRGMIRKTTP